MKKHKSLKLDTEIIDSLESQAKNENRSFNNHVENVLRKHVSKPEHSHASKNETK